MGARHALLRYARVACGQPPFPTSVVARRNAAHFLALCGGLRWLLYYHYYLVLSMRGSRDTDGRDILAGHITDCTANKGKRELKKDLSSQATEFE